MPIGMPSPDKMEELVRKAAIARGISPDVAVSLLKRQGFNITPAGGPNGEMNAGRNLSVTQGGVNNIGISGNQGMTAQPTDFGAGAASGGGISSFFNAPPGEGPLDYGGVPLGTRLQGAGEIFSALGQGRQANPRVLGMVGEAKEAARMRGMAENLYNNLKDTNPMLAEAIRMNPALVDAYVKGEIDLNNQKTLAETQHGYRMSEAETQRGWQTEDADTAWDRKKEEIKLEAEYDPKVLAIKEWQVKWKDFIDQSDLGNSSTEEVYRRWAQDPSLTKEETQRLANNNVTEERLNAELRSILDDRSKKKEVAIAGGKLGEDQYITNPDEVAQGKPPIVAPYPGSKLDKEQKVAATKAQDRDASKMFGGDIVVGAIGRLRQSRQRQDAGDSWTGAGETGILGTLPLPTEAGNMNDDLRIITSRLGLDELQKIRDNSPTGGALGPVSDYENRLLQSTIESLRLTADPAAFDQRLNRLEMIYKGILTPDRSDATKSKVQTHIDMLIADPSPEARGEFDEVYGPGMADLLLNNTAK